MGVQVTPRAPAPPRLSSGRHHLRNARCVERLQDLAQRLLHLRLARRHQHGVVVATPAIISVQKIMARLSRRLTWGRSGRCSKQSAVGLQLVAGAYKRIETAVVGHSSDSSYATHLQSALRTKRQREQQQCTEWARRLAHPDIQQESRPNSSARALPPT